MARYSDDDVQRLVGAVEQALHFKLQAPGSPIALERALAPFLPDPEDALVERMAQAMQDRLKTEGGMGQNWHRVTARAALDVVKREGLPT